jgi:predicted O-methyltransferase YrrM
VIASAQRDERLAALMREPRVGLGDARDAVRRLDSVHGLIELLRATGARGPLGTVVEIGCYLGVSTEALLLFAERVIAVDPWDEMELVFHRFRDRLRGYSHLEIIRGRSVEVASEVDDRSVDLVYLDGAHDLASVRADIAAWRPKVKPGGWLAGHDYTPLIEDGAVVRAVDELLGAPDRVFDDTSWLVQLRDG